jgi:hypothetical protein
MLAVTTLLLAVFYIYAYVETDFSSLHLEEDMIKRTATIAKKYHIERNYHVGLFGLINWLCAWASIHYMGKIRKLEDEIVAKED